MNNLTEKETRLCETIKKQFQHQGVFDDIKCQLNAKLVQMMRGGGEAPRSKLKIDNGDSKTQLLNQLIMEYLMWHKFHYTAEMFAMETGTPTVVPNRGLLEAALGGFQLKELPILLEIVIGLRHRERIGDQL